MIEASLRGSMQSEWGMYNYQLERQKKCLLYSNKSIAELYKIPHRIYKGIQGGLLRFWFGCFAQVVSK